MKKIYSLFAAVILAAAVNAQETSATYTISGFANAADLTDGTINNGANGTVTYAWSKGSGVNTPKYYNTGSAGRMYAKNTLTVTVPNNYVITRFVLNGAAGGDYLASEYTIDGGAASTAPKTGTADYTITPSSYGRTLVFTTGPNATSGHSRVTGFTVTYKSATMAVTDLNSSKNVLVKNTNVDSMLHFAAKSDVQILNLNGQVVKAVAVDEDSILDIASLSKGMYLVVGMVNGQKVSQKIIKK